MKKLIAEGALVALLVGAVAAPALAFELNMDRFAELRSRIEVRTNTGHNYQEAMSWVNSGETDDANRASVLSENLAETGPVGYNTTANNDVNGGEDMEPEEDDTTMKRHADVRSRIMVRANTGHNSQKAHAWVDGSSDETEVNAATAISSNALVTGSSVGESHVWNMVNANFMGGSN